MAAVTNDHKPGASRRHLCSCALVQASQGTLSEAPGSVLPACPSSWGRPAIFGTSSSLHHCCHRACPLSLCVLWPDSPTAST